MWARSRAGVANAIGARSVVKLGLFLETSAAQIEQVRAGAADPLGGDARIIADGLRIELMAIGSNSIDLEIHCFIRTSDHAEFLAIRGELLFGKVLIVEKAGTSLAAPGQTHYLCKTRAAGEENNTAANK